MKYTIHGFSQKAALQFVRTEERNGKTVTVRLDITDLAILDWFRNFYPRMKKISADGREFAWLKHSELEKDMPLLNISRKACIERMQKLVKFGILDYKLVRSKGTYSYYAFGPRYMELVSDDCTRSNALNEEDCTRSNVPNIAPVQTYIKDPLTSSYSKKDGSSAKASSPSQKEALDYEAWSKAYSENARSLPGIRLMSDKRKAAVRSMISQGISISDFSEACRMANESDFLTGGGKSGWKANPDWMFNATNVLKVLEGNYSPRKGNNQEAGVISIIDDETRRFLEAM